MTNPMGAPELMQTEHTHEPFSWLSIDAFQANPERFLISLGLEKYCLAIFHPLEAAIMALLEDRPEFPRMSSSQLPKIDRAVLNDPTKLRKLISEVTPLYSGEVTPDQLAVFKCKAQGVYEQDVFKTAYKTKAEPEFNMFDSCSYCIDVVDLQALQLLVKINDFYTELIAGAATESVLFEFGQVYYFYATLEYAKSGLDAKRLLEHVFKLQGQINSLKGGEGNALKAERELEYIKEVVSKLVKDSKHVPWKSINFAVEQTIEEALVLLNPDQPGVADGEEPKFKMSEARYIKVLKLIQEEHPELFRQK